MNSKFLKLSFFLLLIFSIFIIYFFISTLYININTEFSLFNLPILNIYFIPLLYITSLIIMFTIEYIMVGWQHCSLRSILNVSKSTCRVDIFYIWIKLSGISNLIFNLIFFGSGFYLLNLIENFSLININNIYLEFFILKMEKKFSNLIGRIIKMKKKKVLFNFSNLQKLTLKNILKQKFIIMHLMKLMH